LDQLHRHLAVLPVALLVLRPEADQVLVAEFRADLGGNVRHLVHILHRILAPPGLLGDLRQQPRSRGFFRCPAAIRSAFENSHGVDLDVRFAHQVLDFRLRVAAVVVPSVGDQQQGLARIPGLSHFVQTQVHGVQKRGLAFRLGEGEAVLNLLQVGGERLHQPGVAGERYQEKLVLRVGHLEELRHRLARFLELLPHAARAVEDHPHRKRRVLARELADRLLLVVLENAEILLLQTGNEPVQRVGHRHGNQHQVAVDPNVRLRQHRRLLDGGLAGSDRTLLRNRKKAWSRQQGANHQQLAAEGQHHGWAASLPRV
jgi:hypothetical protein